DLDVKRQQHLDAIQQGFRKTKIVVMHGASGQGKSALAYRYLHDYCPAASYEIRDLSTAKRALEVATALSGYNIPFTFYVDASHNDKGLSGFLRRIDELKHIRCLVTIREEDWRLTGITSTDITFADVELVFDREEAQELYAAWENAKGSRFPDFEQAWAKFSEAGPLLEFVHLLTHTENLRHRLQKQYNQIVEEINCRKKVNYSQRSENDLKLIRQVAVAGACGARIDLAKLAQLPGNATLKQSINRLEKEYLLRRSNDARHLTGLHPVRSEILTSIIADPVLCPWEALALECLPLLEDADVEVFLLHIFRFHSEATNAVLSYLNTAKYETWLAVNSVLRALLWLGIYEYLQNNAKLIKQVYDKVGDGWFAVLDFVDFIGVLEGKPVGIIDLLPEEGKKQVEQWQREQLPKSQVFVRVDEWLQDVVLPLTPAYGQENDWNEFGQVVYWTGFREINKRIEEIIDWNALRDNLEKLSIDTLAVLIYGLWHACVNNEIFIQWYENIRPTLLDRYRKETNTPFLEERDGVIRAHFIVPIDDDPKKSERSNSAEKESFHALAMRHVDLLAQLVPDCTEYGCQGYGHQVLDFEYPYDETTKTNIPASQLKPRWVVHVNNTARILGGYMFRPATWQGYSSQMFAIRKDVVSCLDGLRKHLVKHFRSKEVVQELSKFSDADEWKKIVRKVINRPSFPLEALDQFGYTEESKNDAAIAEDNENRNQETIISAYLQQYQPYLQATREYSNSIRNFLNLSASLMIANALLGKAKTPEKRIEIKQKIEEVNLKLSRPLLAAFNLAESIKILQQFQCTFRKHFSRLIDNEELSQLEQRERKTLHSLWPLWFCFETAPSRKMPVPGKRTSGQLEQRKKVIRNKLVKALKKASTENLQFKMLSDSVEFDSKPALWITIDGENPFEVYTQTEQLYKLMRSSWGEIKLHSLDHFVLEFQWQNLLFVPRCKGKLLEPHAWVIPVYKFIRQLSGDKGLGTHNLVPRQIEQETLEVLGIKVWEPALLNDAKIFLQSAATLQILLRHLVQIGDIRNTDEVGERIIRSYYFDQIRDGLNKKVQQMLDQIAKLFSLHEQLFEEDHEISENEYLKLAADKLFKINKQLIPESLKKGRIALSHDSFKKWQEQLLSVQGTVFVIYLYWCGYALHRYNSGVQ
ncbi:MAG: hypothetical protein D3916_07455, partial [Candidatus Electrothrix sp. MAN1_4]|nr:hypothetical protein [Candidatus Electrothrix sp. MAN1_4]